MSAINKPVWCRFCRREEIPVTAPADKKRFVLLICGCCGNVIKGQYTPKKRKGGSA